MHGGRIVHGALANTGSRRRLGYTMRSMVLVRLATPLPSRPPHRRQSRRRPHRDDRTAASLSCPLAAGFAPAGALARAKEACPVGLPLLEANYAAGGFMRALRSGADRAVTAPRHQRSDAVPLRSLRPVLQRRAYPARRTGQPHNRR